MITERAEYNGVVNYVTPLQGGTAASAEADSPRHILSCEIGSTLFRDPQGCTSC